MLTLNVLFVVACGVALSQSSVTPTTDHVTTHGHVTTKATRPTLEPNEREHFSFYYEHRERKLYTRVGHSCYIEKLSLTESAAVHTDVGMQALELKALARLASGVPVQKSNLTHIDKHVCGIHTTAYYLLQ